jgi:hypothetical protein
MTGMFPGFLGSSPSAFAFPGSGGLGGFGSFGPGMFGGSASPAANANAPSQNGFLGLGGFPIGGFFGFPGMPGFAVRLAQPSPRQLKQLPRGLRGHHPVILGVLMVLARLSLPPAAALSAPVVSQGIATNKAKRKNRTRAFPMRIPSLVPAHSLRRRGRMAQLAVIDYGAER